MLTTAAPTDIDLPHPTAEDFRSAFVACIPRAPLFDVLITDPRACVEDFYVAANQQIMHYACASLYAFDSLQHESATTLIAAAVFVLRAHHHTGSECDLTSAAQDVLAAGSKVCAGAARTCLVKSDRYDLITDTLFDDLALALLYRLARTHDFAAIPTPNVQSILESNHVFRSVHDVEYFIRSSLWPAGVLGTTRKPATSARNINPCFISFSDPSNQSSDEDANNATFEQIVERRRLEECVIEEQRLESNLPLAAKKLSETYQDLSVKDAFTIIALVIDYLDGLTPGVVDSKTPLLVAVYAIAPVCASATNLVRGSQVHLLRDFDRIYQNGSDTPNIFKSEFEHDLFCKLSDTTHHYKILAGVYAFLRAMGADS